MRIALHSHRAHFFNRASICLAAACLMLNCGQAQSGPPFRTDDPEPTDYGHYEFFTVSTGTVVNKGTSGDLPGFELDYGLIPNGQLTINANLAFSSLAPGPAAFGLGDTGISFKYRFIEEDKTGSRPQVAIFPAVTLPTGDQPRGLGAGHAAVFLPLWAQKSFGEWTTYGGGGYWINQDDKTGDKNFWFSGWLLQRKITDKLRFGGEIFYQTANNINSKNSTGFNFGGVYDLDDHHHLLLSAGRGIENPSLTNDFSWYVAWKITY